MKKFIFILFLIFTPITFAEIYFDSLKEAYKKNPDDTQTIISLGIYYHDKGVKGDAEAVKESLVYLEKVINKTSDNSIALAWHGSALTLRGRDVFFPWSKLKFVNDGIDEMDKAADKNPTEVSIRMIRAINGVNLPGMFKRLSIAQKDLAYLLKREDFPSWDKKLKAQIYYWNAMAYEKDNRKDKAKEFFKKATETDPESEIGNLAKQKLEGF